METTEINKEKVQEKRNELIGLSKPIRALVQNGEFATINEGLKHLYQQDGHTELKNIYEWNKAGKRVKKGAKALLLWGKPKKKAEQEEQGNQPQEGAEQAEDDRDFFPICYVFSNLQVIEKGGAQ